MRLEQASKLWRRGALAGGLPGGADHCIVGYLYCEALEICYPGVIGHLLQGKHGHRSRECVPCTDCKCTLYIFIFCVHVFRLEICISVMQKDARPEFVGNEARLEEYHLVFRAQS